MKKHIIISGVPRSGKSTICQIIAKDLGYQHISMDSIIAGIEKTFPESKIDTDSFAPPYENLKSISSKMGPFIRSMMDSGEYDELDYGMVIDIYQLLPEDYTRYIDPSKCDIYYFITSEVTAQERFELLKKYDTPKDYTYYHSDEEKKKSCASLVKVSTQIREQCRLYSLPFFETSNDRNTLIETFIDSLKENAK